MTPLELLRFFGKARGFPKLKLKERIEAVVDQCSLDAVLEKSIYKLPKGYCQRLGMVQVLVHEPAILVTDEPTSGLIPTKSEPTRVDKRLEYATHFFQLD